MEPSRTAKAHSPTTDGLSVWALRCLRRLSETSPIRLLSKPTYSEGIVTLVYGYKSAKYARKFYAETTREMKRPEYMQGFLFQASRAEGATRTRRSWLEAVARNRKEPCDVYEKQTRLNRRLLIGQRIYHP